MQLSICLSHSQILLFLLHSFTTTASPTNIWHVSVLEAPAPPPGEGVPLQASALRDPAYLPAQISAIVAAYVLSVLIIGSAILFVGRRLRRVAQASPGTLSMEMMKPVRQDVAKAFDPSPISPKKDNLYGPSPNSTIDMKDGWPSPRNKGTRNSSGWGSITKGHKKQTSVQSSVVTFDETIIEDDKARNQKEMENLYKAVFEHDEQKSTSVLNVVDGQHPQNPPELQHLRTTEQVSAPLRADTKLPTRTLTSSLRKSSKPTPISIHSRASSRSSFGSFGKKRGIRNLPISPPMGSPDLIHDHNDKYGEAEPLTPRIYDDPGPPPPTPPERKFSRSHEDQIDATRLSPQYAHFPEPSLRKPPSSIPFIQTIPETSTRPGLQSRNIDRSASDRDPTKVKQAPAPLALNTQAAAGASSQRHPLHSAPLLLRNEHPTNYNSNTIKATVLERKAPQYGQHLRTPGTGVPMTPYSPYMPFTPLTPMTPSRLVTREERKRREKEEGRRVVTVEDVVEEEADMWGNAYP